MKSALLRFYGRFISVSEEVADYSAEVTVVVDEANIHARKFGDACQAILKEVIRFRLSPACLPLAPELPRP
jgi:hypothetical protein